MGVLCERATALVDEYTDILGDSFARARISTSDVDAERLRREYVRLLGDFAAAVRDLIPDREARHGVAQAIQCALLRHERRLREVSAPAVQGIELQP